MSERKQNQQKDILEEILSKHDKSMCSPDISDNAFLITIIASLSDTEMVEILKEELKLSKFNHAVEIESHLVHKSELQEHKDMLTLKETAFNRLKEESRFYEDEVNHLNNYKTEADSIINNLSKKIVELEKEILDLKGVSEGKDINRILNEPTSKSAIKRKSSVLNEELELESNFIKREASIKCLDKLKRIRRRTCNQGVMTQIKNTDKYIVAIEEKEYQNYKKDEKLRSNFYL